MVFSAKTSFFLSFGNYPTYFLRLLEVIKIRKMKKILLLSLLLCVTFAFGQNRGPQGNDGTYSVFGPTKATLGYTSVQRPSRKVIKGSQHLFDTWNNSAVVVSKEGKKFKVQNVNFNARRNRFEMEQPGDTLYTFNFKAIDKIVVNNRTFSTVYFEEDERDMAVEEIGVADNFKIIKRYNIEIQVGSPNPMRGSVSDKYLLKDDYYLIKDGEMKKFNPKRKKVSKLMGKKADQVEDYAKENKLSYKDDAELAQIILYYNSL